MSSPNHFDVAIIGSGPSGTITAQKLSSHGLKVILFEKEMPPRYKTCGGGIVKRVTKYLPSKILTAFEKEFNQINISDVKAGFNYKLKRRYPFVYMTMRKDFDSKLLSEAVSSGTILKSNCEVLNIIQNRNSIVLETQKGTFQSYFVVGADGAGGIVIKKSGLKIYKKNMPALEYEIYVSDKDLERFSLVEFDFSSIPGGYAWIFPKKDHLSVGAGIFAVNSLNKNLNTYLNDYITKLNFEKVINIERHGFYVPLGLMKNKIASGNMLLVGDAAALADPVTAEGITSAVLSGKLAAESIIEENMNRDRISDSYNRKIEKHIYSDIKAGLMLNKIFYQHPTARIFLLRRYGVRFCEIIADVISGEKNYNQLLKNPLNYVKFFKYYSEPKQLIDQLNLG